MAAFLTDLMSSIFTPGPTPSLVLATNASFAALQLVLLTLLLTTYSIHFLILSFLSAGLWWAINWFSREIAAANRSEEQAKLIKERQQQREGPVEDSGTETEDAQQGGGGGDNGKGKQQRGKDRALGRLPPAAGKSAGMEREEPSRSTGLKPAGMDDSLRKRRSLGDVSGSELSTDSEWDRVENEGDGEN